MIEIGLGIGCYQTKVGGLWQEILTWYDERGNRHLSGEEQERQRANRLEAILRSQGIDPNQFP